MFLPQSMFTFGLNSAEHSFVTPVHPGEGKTTRQEQCTEEDKCGAHVKCAWDSIPFSILTRVRGKLAESESKNSIFPFLCGTI